MTNKKKILIAVITLLVIAIPVIAYLIKENTSETVETNTVILDNNASYRRGVDESVFIAIRTAAYRTVTLNIEKPESIYHGTIRKDTFESNDNNISFIIDIPALKISLQARQAVDDNDDPVSDALIQCVLEAERIYKGGTCTDSTSTTPGSIDTVFEIGKDLPITGQNYIIDYESTETGFTLVITFYTETGKQEALDALTSLGYNPAEYTITYQAG